MFSSLQVLIWQKRRKARCFSPWRVSSVNEERLISPTSHAIASQLQKHFLVFIRVRSLSYVPKTCVHTKITQPKIRNIHHLPKTFIICWCHFLISRKLPFKTHFFFGDFEREWQKSRIELKITITFLGFKRNCINAQRCNFSLLSFTKGSCQSFHSSDQMDCRNASSIISDPDAQWMSIRLQLRMQ